MEELSEVTAMSSIASVVEGCILWVLEMAGFIVGGEERVDSSGMLSLT